MNLSKTRKHLSEHEPRTRKKKVEAAREADVDVPPRSQLHGRVDELAFVLGGGSLDEEHSEHTCLHCAAEFDPDYGVDPEDGTCFAVHIDRAPFIPR